MIQKTQKVVCDQCTLEASVLKSVNDADGNVMPISIEMWTLIAPPRDGQRRRRDFCSLLCLKNFLKDLAAP